MAALLPKVALNELPASEIKVAARDPLLRKELWEWRGVGSGGLCAHLESLLSRAVNEGIEDQASDAAAALANLAASEDNVEESSLRTTIRRAVETTAFRSTCAWAVRAAGVSDAAAHAIGIFFENILVSAPTFVSQLPLDVAASCVLEASASIGQLAKASDVERDDDRMRMLGQKRLRWLKLLADASAKGETVCKRIVLSGAWEACADVAFEMVSFDYQASQHSVNVLRNVLIGGSTVALKGTGFAKISRALWKQTASQDHNTSATAAAALRMLAPKCPSAARDAAPALGELDLKRVHPIARVEMARAVAVSLDAPEAVAAFSSQLNDMVFFVAFLLASPHSQLHKEALAACTYVRKWISTQGSPDNPLRAIASKEIVQGKTFADLLAALDASDLI